LKLSASYFNFLFSSILFLFVFASRNEITAQTKVKLDSLQNALEHSRTDTGKVRILIALADHYSKLDFIKALDYGRQALTAARNSKNHKAILYSLQNVGNTLIFIGDYEEALKNLLEGYRISVDNKMDVESLRILNSIGIVYDRLGKFDQALSYYFNSLDLYNKNVNKNNQLFSVLSIQALYNNIGNIYQTKGDLQSAVEYYNKGLKLSIEKNDDNNVGIIAGNLGKISMEQKNYPRALEYLKQSMDARERINDLPGIAKTSYIYAYYYDGLNDRRHAMEYAKKALDIGEKVGALNTGKIAAMELYEYSKKAGDFKEALAYHELYMKLSDSLINEKNVSQVTQLQLKFEYDKLQKEREIKDKRARFVYIGSILALIAGLVIAVLLVIISRNRTLQVQFQNEKLEQDIDLRNKELATNVMYLVKKNELINGVTNKLLTLKEKLDDKNRESMQNIIIELQNLMDKEVWEEFEFRFQQVHHSFYKNLQSGFPELSPAEIKLAAFLRLNMTSKDIASITGQSVKSLEVARARLRKKLGITNQDVNLVNFLLEI
jgi:tetratricopeptide (TPR) repeat protein